MAAYCLPRSFVAKFIREVRPGGSIDPYRLEQMDSAGRRQALTNVLGDEEHAKQVNALFEEKQLLKYKSGLQDWVSRVIAPEPIKKTMADTIAGLDSKILDPANAQKFYQDLAEKKLGFQVTETEAKQIFQAAQDVKAAKGAWEQTLGVDVKSSDYFKVLRGKKNSASPTVLNAIQARNDYSKAVIALNDTMSDIRHEPNFVNALLSLDYAPKTLETGFLHLSAFGVQLWGSWTRPETWSGFAEQIKYFASEENYQQLQGYIISHPYYQYALQAKLGLTDIKGITSSREEDIQSPLIQAANTFLAEKLGALTASGKPLPINVFRASSRGFTGYLNYVRFNTFVAYLNAIKAKNADDLYPGSQLTIDAANTINTLSGRSNIGPLDKYATGAVPLGNTVFFTIRKVAADINMLNPYHYSKLAYDAYKTGNWAVFNRAVFPLAAQIGVIGAILHLANSMHPFGVHAQLNPLAQDFGEVTFPSGEKLSLMGSERTLIRLAARLMANKEISSQGKEIQLGGSGPFATTRGHLIWDEIRNKLGPAAGFIADWSLNKDAIGREFNMTTELRDRLEPIIVKNILSYWYNNPDKSLADIPNLSMLAGVPTQSPLPPGERAGLTAWGEDYNASWFHDPDQRDLVDTEMKKIGLKASFPGPTVNGVKLNPDQYKAYIKLSGTDAKQRLETLMSSPNWEGMPTMQKQMLVKTIVDTSRITAQTALHLAFLNTGNDILDKALKGITGTP